MKKLLLVLAIGAFVACNDSTDDTKSADTTVVTPVDTVSRPVDTTMRPVDSAGRPVDTTAKK